MRAMVLRRPGVPLELVERDIPVPAPGQVLVRVEACAVCRTDLHLVDGELTQPALPIVPGHQIAGTVAGGALPAGTRVGVPWLAWTCGTCGYCQSGLENLCDAAKFTGYTVDGGFADYAIADARFCFRIPDAYNPTEAAPLLCAGLIGYRAYRFMGDALRIGVYGFGSSAQILAQVARADGREIYAFTRAGDTGAQEFAMRMGAEWAGDSSDRPPRALDAAVIFAPAGALVPQALRGVRKSGVVVCAGIHMSDIPTFPYSLLWGERVVRSVANLTRADAIAFFERLLTLRIHTESTPFRLERANEALDALRSGAFTGTAVIEA